MHALLFLALVAADAAALPGAPDDEEPAAQPVPPEGPRWTRPGWGFGGVPALGYDPDAGFLFGLIGSIFHYDGVTAPYREAVGFQVLMTHKLVQDHVLVVDALRVLDLPVRLNARVGFSETFGQNYCGVGSDVTCDPRAAERDADALGLADAERDAFLRHYYVFPYIAPNAALNVRWRINEVPRGAGANGVVNAARRKSLGRELKVEILAGWRAALYIPGTVLDEDGDGRLDLLPYGGSRYAADFPGGEPGLASVVQTGLIVDHRDNEPSPRQGWLAEASVRAAHPFTGSAWTWAGGNVTLRGYTPLLGRFDRERRLIVAARLILDGVVGDPPVVEMARIGGSVDLSTYGGTDLGRGIRGQRYLGRVKILEQQEIRWHFYEVDALGQRFGFVTNAFLDAGFVSLAFDDLGAAAPSLPIGFGAALALSWNENFIVRVDVAASSVEGFAPYPYITLGQSF